MPITRYGGAGVVRGWKVPGFVVHPLKRRGYGVKKAKDVVERGVGKGRARIWG